MYITWEVNECSSSFDNTSYEDEIAHICLMVCHKNKDSEVGDSESHFIHSYDELLNVFHKIHDEALKAFKNISLQNKMILKHEDEILKLKYALESYKDDHASIMNDQFCSLHTL